MRSIFIALVFINVVVFAALFFTRSPAPDVAAPPARAPVLEGAALHLLGEDAAVREDKKVSANEKKTASVSSPGTGESASGMCTMVGPYIQLLHAEYLVDRLDAMEVMAEIRSIEVPDGTGYWVYLPPEVSEKEALRRLYELQAKKIDSYIIPNGELARGISLGIFNEEASAAAHIRSVGDQGYKAELREVARTISETWVVLPIAEAEKIDAAVWVDLLRQQAGLEKRQNYCLGVAPN